VFQISKSNHGQPERRCHATNGIPQLSLVDWLVAHPRASVSAGRLDSIRTLPGKKQNEMVGKLCLFSFLPRVHSSFMSIFDVR
jgi:hypothetical protein